MLNVAASQDRSAIIIAMLITGEIFHFLGRLYYRPY